MSRDRKTHGMITACLIGTALVVLGCREGHHHYHSPTAPPDVIVGSGHVVHESRPISGVNGLKLVGIGSVDLVQSGSEGLVVEAEDNLLQYLTTEMIGETLVISQDPTVSLQPTRRVVFHLDVNSIARAELIGTGDIECQQFSTDRLELSAVGVGNLHFSNLSLDALEVTIAGVGHARLSGATSSQHVIVAGVGSYEAKRLDSSFARMELASVGSATVHVRDRLEAIVAGPGCLYYAGDPVVDASGAGCIRHIN